MVMHLLLQLCLERRNVTRVRRSFCASLCVASLSTASCHRCGNGSGGLVALRALDFAKPGLVGNVRLKSGNLTILRVQNGVTSVIT
jgi:hypothetical protein